MPTGKQKVAQPKAGPVARHILRGPDGKDHELIVMGNAPQSIQGSRILSLLFASALVDMKMQLLRMRQERSQNHFHSNPKEDLIKIGLSFSRYLHDNTIPTALFVDRSARLGYMTLIKSWSFMYPGEKRPEIYFINPVAYTNWFGSRSAADFKKQHSYLSKRANLPIAIFDTCVHKGEAMENVVGILKGVGFEQIHACIVDPDIPVKVEGVKYFPILEEEASNGCLPFGAFDAVRKGDRFVTYPDPETRVEALQIRREISEAFRDFKLRDEFQNQRHHESR